MNTNKYIAYFRVSTAGQKASGLGLEAQQSVVENFIRSNGGELVKSVTEVESGRRNDRPVLLETISECKRRNYSILVAKLDRISRSLHFLTGLVESKVSFVIAENPSLTSNPFVLQVLGAVAEHEARLISQRTKSALEACKARGVRLGTPQPEKSVAAMASANRTARQDRLSTMLPIIREIQSAGVKSLYGICRALAARGVKPARGDTWHPSSVRNLLNAGLNSTQAVTGS